MISFNDVKAQAKAVGFETLRAENDLYLEAVFVKAKIGEFSALLNGIFGKIAWPSDSPIPDDVKGSIAKYGGVMNGQTLYFVNEGSHVIFAMLWPWGDREHITLKMGEKI
jgi:hypothetical protein